MPRIQGLAETGVLTGSQVVKPTEGYVFSITISWTGAAVGDKVHLRDGDDATDPAEVTFVFATANGTITREWTQGKKFDTGIYYDEGTAANVFTEMTFK